MELSLNNRLIRVYTDGTIEVKRPNRDVFYDKKLSIFSGYLQLILDDKGKQKHYYIHRLVACAYLGLDLEDKKQIVDHIDGDRLNNDISNLRIVTKQQNGFNTKARGCSWHKQAKKWRARIMLDGKEIALGLFDTEEEARQAYLRGKEIHHLIPKNIIST
jgi:hypothetical protein